jgi:photosystem II stability/assembly factor-like uncharacterized protein
MIKKLSKPHVILVAFMVIFFGCERFDRSKIKMPEFKFVTTESLHSIAYVDAQHMWVSGNYGTILFSSDGGKTWEKQKSGIKELLLGSIAFANQSEGWTVGVKGTVVHTSDGGKTWATQQSGTGNDLFDLFFLDARHGWAVGEFGTIIHTQDSGKTWTSQIEEQDTIYNDVFFVDRQTGWVVGEFGTILHTVDGGKTWQPQECKDIVPVISEAEWEKPLPALYGIYFLDRNTGWIVGMDGVVIKTTDGGVNWKKMYSGTDKPLYSIAIKGSKGWVVGNKGIYLMSEDSGETWAAKPEAIKTKFWLREVSFCDDMGLIIGSRGTIVRSSDGGSSWDIISGFRYDMEEFGLADF